MKRALLFLLMMGCMLVYSQEYRNGFRGVSSKMPITSITSQTEEEIQTDPLTTGVEVPVLPPERSGDHITPITGVKVKVKPPERGFGINPNVGVTAKVKPPERGFGINPNVGVTAKVKPPERGFGINPNVGVTAKVKPPERGFGINPNVGVTAKVKPPERGFGINPNVGVTAKVKPPERGNRDFVNPIMIGQAGNAYGFAYTRNTFLWAEQDINTISFVHRMNTPPGTGYLAYDVSKDGGMTWESNIQVYDPTLPDAFNARYPQGAIYNPEGNTDPNNAYFHYFAPTLDGSNTGGENNWGGYAHGVRQLSEGAAATQTNRATTPPFYQCLPAAFTITRTGEAWMVDESTQGDNSGYNYAGDLIIGHGVWDPDISDFQYSYSLMTLEIDPGDDFNDWKIAFSPDGQIGWIFCLTNLAENLPYTSYHPVLFKSVDAGETWEGPYEVQLGGEYGLEPVRQFITDETLGAFFDPEPVPPRDQIDYFMGYEGDLVVDALGNPHIIGMVAIADNAQGLFYNSEGLVAMFHIWSDDLGQTWEAFNLANLHRFDAVFTTPDGDEMDMYNRPQAASTPDGRIIFFSWLDTDNPDIDDNSQPDIFFREYFPLVNTHGEEVVNVTMLSAAMWSAFYGCMSHYVFAEVDGDNYTCTIPFVYEGLSEFDPSQPVQFYYIPDFTREYTITSTGIDDDLQTTGLTVSQNYPNPANDVTTIKVQLPYDSRIELEVYNVAGSLVYSESADFHSRDWICFTINPAHWSPGIYFYRVSSESETMTRKMVIQ
jgi:hypothetical protein